MKLKDIIEEYISGDWGNEDFSPETPCAVYCVRGADIVPISNDQFNDIPLRYVSKRTKDNKTLRAGDLVIEKSGGSPVQSTGRITYISQELIDSKQSVVCSNFCTSIRIKDSWNSKFIYYYWQYIYNSGVFFNFEGKTSGLKNLQFDNAISSIDIPEYTLEQQTEIADILSKLESKMTVNREINRNLEAMARQLYDYWFVQFDFPDENGRPYKSSGGKMVWNEKLKREIPEGWMSKMIRDMSEIQRESCTPNVSLDTIYHLFSIPAFDKTGAYVLESGTEIQSDKFVITKDDILISKLNPWTSRVVWCGDYPNQIASTEFVVLRPRIEDRGYLYMALKDPKLIAYASKGATGTSNSHKRVNPEFLTAYRIPYEPSVVRKFSESINSIQNQLLKNRNEINILITQREELLPLLINGQVSVMPTAVNCDLSHD